jgi:hypothetical protein
MACTADSPGPEYPNEIWRRVQTIEILVKQLFIHLCYLLPLKLGKSVHLSSLQSSTLYLRSSPYVREYALHQQKTADLDD